jgi:cytochrome c oxidase subunit 1
MGLVYHLLPRWATARRAAPGRVLQPWLYGLGQLMHIVGLVWSGGYGVQRKVAGAEQVLRSTARSPAWG